MCQKGHPAKQEMMNLNESNMISKVRTRTKTIIRVMSKNIIIWMKEVSN